MFSIKKLTVSGPNKRDSEIIFGNRLTIIQGPSNTGKTTILKCIEYLLGGNETPISDKHGYDTLSLEIEKNNCCITFTRRIGENKVVVNSSDETIPSDTYSIKSDGIKTILLKLIGINKPVKILSNKSFKRIQLTWNTFRHLLFIDESRIISTKSIINSPHDAAKTSMLSAFYYLSTGDSLEDKAELMSKTIHDARKDGILGFIKDELNSLKERKNKLTDTQNQNNNNQLDIQKLSSELQKLDSEIRKKIEQNHELLLDITGKREELSNISLLLARYSDLKSQYLSDQKRLNFIADGEITLENEVGRSKEITCPICHNLVNSSPNESYLASAQAEFQKIGKQLIELDKAISSLSEKKRLLEESMELVNKKYVETTRKINKELIPQAKSIDTILKEYEHQISTQSELEIINRDIDHLSEQYDTIKSESVESVTYHPKDYYSEIQSALQKIIDTLLRKCRYTNYVSSEFNLEDMDVIVNGQKKQEAGKGYRAYLNSIVAYGTLSYLKQNGKYPLPFLIYDSPVLSLKEPDAISDPMKTGLFETLQENTSDLQIIIIENEIPNIQYLESTHIVKFTKDEKMGRYGFLEDVRE